MENINNLEHLKFFDLSKSPKSQQETMLLEDFFETGYFGEMPNSDDCFDNDTIAQKFINIEDTVDFHDFLYESPYVFLLYTTLDFSSGKECSPTTIGVVGLSQLNSWQKYLVKNKGADPQNYYNLYYCMSSQFRGKGISLYMIKTFLDQVIQNPANNINGICGCYFDYTKTLGKNVASKHILETLGLTSIGNRALIENDEQVNECHCAISTTKYLATQHNNDRLMHKLSVVMQSKFGQPEKQGNPAPASSGQPNF